VAQAQDAAAAHDGGAVQADEVGRIEAIFQPLDGVQHQIAARPHVQAHIVALGIDAVDIGGGHAHQLAAVRHPEFLDPRRRGGSRSGRSRGGGQRRAASLKVAWRAKARSTARSSRSCATGLST
jgi:hypothetical protein